jgi:hypothetical protein
MGPFSNKITILSSRLEEKTMKNTIRITQPFLGILLSMYFGGLAVSILILLRMLTQ